MVNHFLKFVCSKKSMSNCVCEVGSSSCSDLPVLSTIASRSPSLAFAIIVVLTWYSSSSTSLPCLHHYQCIVVTISQPELFLSKFQVL